MGVPTDPDRHRRKSAIEVRTVGILGNSHRHLRHRWKVGEPGEVGEYAMALMSARSVNIRNLLLRLFVFCRLRNVLGRMG